MWHPIDKSSSGPLDATTDVKGVEVGQVTLDRGKAQELAKLVGLSGRGSLLLCTPNEEEDYKRGCC